MDPTAPHGRSADPSLQARASGCLLSGILLFVELSVALGIADTVREALAPALAARGFPTKLGSGFLIGLGLGGIVAIYPVIWLDRLRRGLVRRLTHRRPPVS